MSENRPELIKTYNQEYGTDFKTITEVYYHAGSTRESARRLRVTASTITTWVRADGGFIRDRGGANRKSELYSVVEAIPVKEPYSMQHHQLAKMIGSNVSWAGALKRRRMVEVLEGV